MNGFNEIMNSIFSLDETSQALAIAERYQRIGLIFYVSGVMTVKLVSSNLIAFLDYQPRRCKIRVFGENKTQFFSRRMSVSLSAEVSPRSYRCVVQCVSRIVLIYSPRAK